MSSLTELLIIAVLILFNALFVAAEIALVTVRRTRLEQLVDEGNRSARRVKRLTEQPGRFLAVIQVGITFIGFLAAAYAGVNLAGGLETVLDDVEPIAPQAGTIALLIVTATLSLVTIIFGELVPKSLALAHAERFALLLVRPIELLGRLLAPIVWLLTVITNAVTRLLGAPERTEERISSDELRLLVERGGEQGVLEAEEEQMIGAVLEMGGRRVHEVMVPRVDMVAVNADSPIGDVIDTIVREGHSRIPVFEGTVDEVVGILYAKDLLPYLKGTDDPPPLRALLRKPLWVPESMSIDDLLHTLQRGKVHIAIVVDEYGGTAGLVTIEDLIEEIVGEIQDEYDVEEPMVERLSENEARVDGRASVDDLEELFGVKFDAEHAEEFDTVGGLVYHEIGGIPKVGDVVNVDGVLLTVETTDGRRVGKVLAVRQSREDASGQGDSP